MTDYIQNFRNNTDKWFDRNRRPYNGGPRGSSNSRRQSIDKRKGHQHFTDSQGENLSAIKTLLENIAENQKRQTDIEEKKVLAEERKAVAFEDICECLKELVGSNSFSLKKKEPEYEIADENGIEISDPDREMALNLIATMREEGATFDEIALQMEKEKIPTFSGRGKWHAQTVHKAFNQSNEVV